MGMSWARFRRENERAAFPWFIAMVIGCWIWFFCLYAVIGSLKAEVRHLRERIEKLEKDQVNKVHGMVIPDAKSSPGDPEG